MTVFFSDNRFESLAERDPDYPASRAERDEASSDGVTVAEPTAAHT